MKSSKIFNKTAKGIVSLLTIVIVLMSVLASTIYYNNNITANVAKENLIQQSPQIKITTINDINELSEFNEGWYAVRNGFVYYLEGFNSYVPLNVRILSKEQQNGFVLVEDDGNVIFDTSYDNLLFKKPYETEKTETIDIQQYSQQSINQETQQTNAQQTTQQTQTQNQITGAVTGLEGVTGMQGASTSATSNTRRRFTFTAGGTTYTATRVRSTRTESVYSITNPNNNQPAYVGNNGMIYNRNGNNYVQSVTQYQNVASFTQAYNSASAAPVTPGTRQPVRAAGEALIGPLAPATSSVHLPPLINIPIQTVTEEGQPRTQSNPYIIVDVQGTTPGLYGREGSCGRATRTCVNYNPATEVLICNSVECVARPKSNDAPGTTASGTAQAAGSQAQEQRPLGVSHYNGHSYEAMREGDEVIIYRDGREVNSIPNDLAGGINWDRYDGSNDFPLSNGGTRHIDNLQCRSGCTVTDTTAQSVTQAVYEQRDGTIRRTSQTTTNSNTQGTTSEVYTFSDGTTRTITYNTATQEDTSDITNVVYSTRDPRTGRERSLRVGNDDYSEIPQANRDRMLTVAAQEGFSGSNLNYDNGVLRSGDMRIQRLEDDLVVLDDDRVVRSVFVENGQITSNIFFSGDVTIGTLEGTQELDIPNIGVVSLDFSLDQVQMGGGASYIERDSQGNLISSAVNSGNGRTRTEVVYNTDDIMTITTLSFENGVQTGTSQPITASEVFDTSNQFYGMIRFELGGVTYYVEANSFGSYSLYYQGADGNRAEVDIETDLIPGLRDAMGAVINGANQRRKAEGRPTLRQQASRAFFADVERIFTEFRGLGYIATYFLSDSYLSNWRENVDRAFSSLYLGSEYWESEICASNIDSGSLGFVYAETPQGIAQVAAHIEGTRTAPIYTGSGTEYLYVITFEVKNGDSGQDTRAPEEMKIKVRLKKEDGQFVDVFNREKTLKRGETWKKAGNGENPAIVDYSATKYLQVCLEFDHIPSTWQLPDKRLCNSIPESTGQPTSIEQAEEAEEGEPQQNDF